MLSQPFQRCLSDSETVLYSNPKCLLISENPPHTRLPPTAQQVEVTFPTYFFQTTSCPAFSATTGGKLVIGFVFAFALNVARMSSVLFAFHAP